MIILDNLSNADYTILTNLSNAEYTIEYIFFQQRADSETPAIKQKTRRRCDNFSIEFNLFLKIYFTADSEIDTTQQATSETPPPQKQKNPKRVAAGKAIAEKTRQAREAQKKKLAEYEARENDQIKTGPPAPAVAAPADEPAKTAQWLTVIGFIISLAGLYYKREEIKSFLPTKKPQAPPSPVLPPAPPPSPVLPPARRIRKMD